MRTAVLAAMLAATLPLYAQIDNGNITGRVTDPSGAAIAGAQVTLTQTETNFETAAVTNQDPLKWYNWGGPNTQLNVQSLANAAVFGKINPGNNGETATGTAGFGGTPLLNMTVALKW